MLRCILSDLSRVANRHVAKQETEKNFRDTLFVKNISKYLLVPLEHIRTEQYSNRKWETALAGNDVAELYIVKTYWLKTNARFVLL